MKIVFSTGEASGDAYAAALAERLKPVLPDNVFLLGLGSRRSREAGIEILHDTSRWAAMGIFGSMLVAPRILWALSKFKRFLRKSGPGLFVPIDFGYVNVRLARYAKKHGWKVLYFIPPGSWRKDRQGGDLAEVTDEIVTPFPWSAELLEQAGASAHFFGHPLKEMAQQADPPTERTGVVLLPGSRLQELQLNVPLLAAAVEGLDQEISIGLAPSISDEVFRGLWQAAGGKEVSVVRDVRSALRSATAGLICSGTVTLEAALAGCPSVVFYRVSKMIEWEGRMLTKNLRWVSLPNILLEEGLLPELLQEKATPEALRSHLDKLLVDSPERAAQLDGFQRLDSMLEESNCLAKTTDLIRKMINLPESGTQA